MYHCTCLEFSRRSTFQTKLHIILYENQKGYYLRNRYNLRGNAHAAIHLMTINQFLKRVYLRTITAANILFIIKQISYHI